MKKIYLSNMIFLTLEQITLQRLQVIYLLSYIYFLCQNSWESTTTIYYINLFEIHDHLLIKFVFLLWKSSLLSLFVYFLENVGTF